jgi:hypothetical protein
MKTIKLNKKLLILTSCILLPSLPAHAQFVFNFNQVGSDVHLTYSGDDILLGSRLPLAITHVRLSLGGSGIAWAGGQANSPSSRFEGDDLLGVSFVSGNLGNISSEINAASVNAENFTFALGNQFLTTVPGGFRVNVAALIAEGPVVFTNTTLADRGIDQWDGLGPTDIWREGGSVGNEGLVQFNVGASPVPEPTSIMLLGFSGLAIILRRKRA